MARTFAFPTFAFPTFTFPTFAFPTSAFPALALLLSLILLNSKGFSQASQEPIYTLRPTVTEINLDLVVTDAQGHPVQGITARDLVVREDGQPQTLRSFTPHTLDPAAAAAVPALTLPPNTFTNYLPTPRLDASFILLFDSLDTPVMAQAYAYDQAVEFLKHLPAGANVSIFDLNARMELIQGFTTDQKLLLAAVAGKRARPHLSALLNSDPGGSRAIRLETEKEIVRQQYLAAGFAMLNRYLAAYPGRKNLIWLTVDIPGNHSKGPPASAPVGATGGADVAAPVLPDQNPPGNVDGSSPADQGRAANAADPRAPRTPSTPTGQAYAFRDDLSIATGALTLSRVAIYPIDARGLMGPFDLAANPDYQAQQSAMQEVADATGGRAVFNSNRLDLAMADIVTEGSAFYTLTYTPTRKEAHGEYRRISLAFAGDYTTHPLSTVSGKPVQGPLKLTCRPGYVAAGAGVPQKKAAGSGDFLVTQQDQREQAPDPSAGHVLLPRLPKETLQLSMTVGQLAPTEVIFSASIKPQPGAFQLGKGSSLPPGDYRRARWMYQPYQVYDVLFATDTRRLTLPRAEDGLRHGQVEFVAVVYDDKGEVVNTFIDRVSLDLRDRTYQAMLQTGVGDHHKLAIPVKGQFTVRLGVRDVGSDHVGAVEIPLTSVH